MSLKDRFRINELAKFGSKAIPRRDDKSIVVKRVNNTEVNSNPISDLPKPFGEEPIKIKTQNPRTKEDTVIPSKQEIPQQESFGGETSTYIEKPIYNEEELKKAVDVKVDELIKEKKPPRGEFIRKDKFDNKVNELLNANNTIQDLKNEINKLKAQISNLESQLSTAQTQTESALAEVDIKDISIEELLNRYNTLLADFQNVVIKSTRESVERASVSGQVRGLQAQKETLSAQLEAQKGINTSLQEQIQSQRDQFTATQEVLVAQTNALSQQLAAAQTAAAESQAAAAEAQAESASKGKKIICNELYRQGYLTEDIWIADEKFGDWLWETNRKTAIGYTIWARKVVRFMQQKPQYTKYIYKFLKPWTQQMAYQMGVVEKTHLMGWLTMKIGWWFSNLIYMLHGDKFEKVLTRLNRIN